ncbi:unnamed protein product [Closterium sp. NIES-64]|nr:unnamed protein product [Closterium sp. NIES-64]
MASVTAMSFPHCRRPAPLPNCPHAVPQPFPSRPSFCSPRLLAASARPRAAFSPPPKAQRSAEWARPARHTTAAPSLRGGGGVRAHSAEGPRLRGVLAKWGRGEGLDSSGGRFSPARGLKRGCRAAAGEVGGGDAAQGWGELEGRWRWWWEGWGEEETGDERGGRSGGRVRDTWADSWQGKDEEWSATTPAVLPLAASHAAATRLRRVALLLPPPAAAPLRPLAYSRDATIALAHSLLHGPLHPAQGAEGNKNPKEAGGAEAFGGEVIGEEGNEGGGKERGPGRVVLVGHSAGCLPAIEAALARPDLFSALVLIAPALVLPLLPPRTRSPPSSSPPRAADHHSAGEAAGGNEGEAGLGEGKEGAGGAGEAGGAEEGGEEARDGGAKRGGVVCLVTFRCSLNPSLRLLPLLSPGSTSNTPPLTRAHQVRAVMGTVGVAAVKQAWSNPSLCSPAIVDGYTKPLACRNWDRALIEFTVAATLNPNTATKLHALNLPVLVVAGRQDKILPHWSARRVAAALRNAKLVILEECGHVPQEENPDVLLTAIADFLGHSGPLLD